MNRIIPIIVLTVIAFFLFTSLNLDYGQPKHRVFKHYIAHGVVETGARNLVTAIYLDYRVYDTLGEATIFFSSALGVFILLQRYKGRP